MTTSDSTRPREDVLNDFAVEPDASRATLERYLREYPQYAAELIDLSRELSRASPASEQPLSDEDHALIDAAWHRYAESASLPAIDPLAALSIAEQRAIARQLDVPRQVITALREHRVIVASVPRPFMTLLADAVQSSFDRLCEVLALEPAADLVRSHKSDTKPTSAQRVTFEQLLIDAGVAAERRKQLMAQDD